MKLKKERITITLSPEIVKFIEDNYTKKSRFIEYCILNELQNDQEFKDKLKEI